MLQELIFFGKSKFYAPALAGIYVCMYIRQIELRMAWKIVARVPKAHANLTLAQKQ
jgi:hypothetical protein